MDISINRQFEVMKSSFRGCTMLIVCTALLVGCSQQKPSNRDIARQQQISLAEMKRTELAQIAGEHAGTMLGDGALSQSVVLFLQVRDVPQGTSGEGVDPILIPKLMGYLRFVFGSEADGEYSDAPIQSAEYFSSQKRLNLVVTHSQFGELILNLVVKDSLASGSWGANAAGVSGLAEFKIDQGN